MASDDIKTKIAFATQTWIKKMATKMNTVEIPSSSLGTRIFQERLEALETCPTEGILGTFLDRMRTPVCWVNGP